MALHGCCNATLTSIYSPSGTISKINLSFCMRKLKKTVRRPTKRSYLETTQEERKIFKVIGEETLKNKNANHNTVLFMQNNGTTSLKRLCSASPEHPSMVLNTHTPQLTTTVASVLEDLRNISGLCKPLYSHVNGSSMHTSE